MSQQKNIILLHGALGAADQLEPLKQRLNDLGFKAHPFIFSGHGQTPFQSGFGIEQFAAELQGYISDNQLNKPHVVGYSMGGYVALYLASQQTDLIGKIVTLGTKFNWTKEIAEKESKQLDPELLIQKVPKFAESLQVRHGSEWRQLLQKTSAMMHAMGNANPLHNDLLEAIDNEVLIGIADRDAMVSLDETTQVYKQLRNSQMYMLPNTEHPIETVNLNVWVSILLAFLP